MRRSSFLPVLALAFSSCFLLSGFLMTPRASAETAGWYQQDTGTGMIGLYCVSAVDTDTVWAAGGAPGLCVRSTDGGSTWEQYIFEPPSIYDGLHGISGYDADTAWAGGQCGFDWMNRYGHIVGTTDGGASWSLQLGVWRGGIEAVSAVDLQTAWAAGYGYTGVPLIVKTTDGVTWDASPLYVTPFSIYGISAVDADTVWAVGSGGTIIQTSDGENWANQDSPVTNTLMSVSAVDAEHAWAVGAGGAIINTTDGSTWSEQDSGVTVNLTGVSAVDPDTAWAVGDGGAILKTVDGGENWGLQNSGVSTEIKGVSAVDADTAWAVDGSGLVLHTTDGGGAVAPSVTSITPTYGVENTIADISDLAGSGFQPGATVRIEREGTTVNATDVNVVSSTQITCKLNLSGAPLGKYDVVVRNPDAQEAKLTQGFSVTNICGGGAAVSLSIFGIMMGLMSLAGSAGLRRRFRRKKR